MLAKCQLFIQNYVILNLIKFMKDIILTTWQFTVMKWGWSHHWGYGRYFPWARPPWILLLGPMCWISHFGPDGHEMRVISLIRVIVSLLFSWIGPNFFHHGLLWGRGYGVHYCWAIDGQNVMVFVRMVTVDFFWSWIATWFGY